MTTEELKQAKDWFVKYENSDPYCNPPDAMKSNGRAEYDYIHFEDLAFEAFLSGFKKFSEFCNDYVFSDFDPIEAERRRFEDLNERRNQERIDFGY